jgi:hypothetical protein
LWICCRSLSQVDSVSDAFFVSSHSSAIAVNVLVTASRSARRFAPGSIPSATARRASSRFSRARFKETSGYVPRVSNFLYPTKVVLEAPEASAGTSDQHEQPPLIKQLVGLFSGFSRASPQFREYWHAYGVPSCESSRYPGHIPPRVLRCPRTAVNASGRNSRFSRENQTSLDVDRSLRKGKWWAV